MNDYWKRGGGEWRRFWFLPIAAALGYSTAVLHTYGIGPFIAPLQHEFGWSRAQPSIGITIAGLAGAGFSVPMGMLVDRLGPRPVADRRPVDDGFVRTARVPRQARQLTGSCCGASSHSRNLGLQATVWTSAVASRFEESRGLAFAITLSGASLERRCLPVLATWLIGSYGWRTAFMAMGGIWAALVFPVMFCFFAVRETRAAERACRLRRER